MSTSSSTLRTELIKQAKLKGIQGGLPIAIRALPVLAIAAGDVVSKVTKERNVVEERLLGSDDVLLFEAPEQEGCAEVGSMKDGTATPERTLVPGGEKKGEKTGRVK